MKTRKKKYVTIQEGLDFRTIAKIMTNKGYTMNHATARNILMSAIKNLLNSSSNQVGIRLNNESIQRIIKDQDMHHALAEALFVAYHKEKKNE